MLELTEPKMRVILVGPNLQEVHIMLALAYVEARLFQNLIHPFVKYHPSIFRRKDKVIQQYIHCIAPKAVQLGYDKHISGCRIYQGTSKATRQTPKTSFDCSHF